MAHIEKTGPEVWAIGGGKGGIGKSFLISSVGTFLALKGKRVTLIDADFGGANLHTFLGVNRPKRSLTDFFEKKLPLVELAVDTSVKNMQLLAGTIHSLAPDSIKFTQKLKFFRHIRQLDTDYTLIDIGAGAHFNSIDTFLLADKMIIVITPEIIAVENFYYFLNNVFYRNLVKALGTQGFKGVIQDTWKSREDYDIRNLKQLIDYLKTSSEPIKRIIDSEISKFTIYIIVNKVRSNEEITVGNSIKSICMKHLGLNARYLGYVELDEFISSAINKREPYMHAYSTTRCAKEIERIGTNLLEENQIRLV